MDTTKIRHQLTAFLAQNSSLNVLLQRVDPNVKEITESYQVKIAFVWMDFMKIQYLRIAYNAPINTQNVLIPQLDKNAKDCIGKNS